MPTEQQPAFVTKREVDGAMNCPDYSTDLELRLAKSYQHAMTLLGQECFCGTVNGKWSFCQPCQRKAKLLRVWNGKATSSHQG